MSRNREFYQTLASQVADQKNADYARGWNEAMAEVMLYDKPWSNPGKGDGPVPADPYWEQAMGPLGPGAQTFTEEVKALPDGEVRVTSATGGQKGSKLARFDLIPPGVLWELAEHYGKGAEKYDDDNWKKGYDWKFSFASAIRHLMTFWAGEDMDEEFNPPTKHVVAAAWHCIALAWFMDNHPDYDSRKKRP